MSPVSLSRLKLPAAALAGLFVVGACLSDPAPATEAPTATPGASATATAIVQDTPAPTVAPAATPRPHHRRRARGHRPRASHAPAAGRQPQRHRGAARRRALRPALPARRGHAPGAGAGQGLAPRSSRRTRATSWSIPIKADAKFHSGQKLKARRRALLAAHGCVTLVPAGTDAVRDRAHLHDRRARPRRQRRQHPARGALRALPDRGRSRSLPILSEDDVKAATRELHRCRRTGSTRTGPTTLIAEIYENTLSDECAVVEPPEGCRLADYRKQLERVFGRARIDLPSEAPYTDDTGLLR